MNVAEQQILNNHTKHASTEATRIENERCTTILEIALKSPHSVSDEFLGRMSLALKCMDDKSCHWSEAKKRFSKMESGESPQAAAEPMSQTRAEELMQRTLNAGKNHVAGGKDLQEQALDLLNASSVHVRGVERETPKSTSTPEPRSQAGADLQEAALAILEEARPNVRP